MKKKLHSLMKSQMQQGKENRKQMQSSPSRGGDPDTEYFVFPIKTFEEYEYYVKDIESNAELKDYLVSL